MGLGVTSPACAVFFARVVGCGSSPHPAIPLLGLSGCVPVWSSYVVRLSWLTPGRGGGGSVVVPGRLLWALISAPLGLGWLKLRLGW